MSKARNSAQMSAQEMMMEQMMEMMKAMSERISALESTPKSAPARTGKSQPKAETKKVPFTKADGTVIYGTQAQVDAWTQYRNRTLTDGQKARIEAIKAGKLLEPKRTRALEKALGIKANSLKSTACTADECRALGWKGTRKELKELKAQVRAKVTK